MCRGWPEQRNPGERTHLKLSFLMCFCFGDKSDSMFNATLCPHGKRKTCALHSLYILPKETHLSVYLQCMDIQKRFLYVP